jgi:hypothetical protein
MSLDAGKWMTSPLSTGADGAASVDYTQTGGTETLSIPDSKVNEIIGKSTDVADIDLTEATNATSASLPKTALTKLADSGLAVELRLPQGTITLNADAASSIAAQAGGGSVSVALKTVSETVLNPAQKAAVGDAPVYDISVTSGSETLTDFGGASVKLELPYALKAGEKPGGVVALYVDGDGNTEALPTVYDESSKKVTFTTTHLSLYAIGYDESISAPPGQTPFADVKEGDWFYEDVAFVAANGLFSGTSGTAFSPNAPMTRAMFVTVLYRLAGSPAVRENAAFDDVDDASWYGEAVNWAAQSGIVSGVGGGLFAPESNLTREQTAVILLGYAKYAGAAPQGAWAVRLDFADTGKIADWATEGAMYCYMNGILTGKPGGLFDPQGEATRAEAAAMLRQFIVAAG